MDDEWRLDDEQLVFGIVGSEYVAEKQTVVAKSAGRVACSVNLQLSQKCATVGWRQSMSAHLLDYSCPLHTECLSVYIY